MPLKIIKQKINTLENIFRQVSHLDYLNKLHFSEDQGNLVDLKARIESHRFEIAVIGEFSTGKSTFINAILNDDILPATYRPTTNQLMRIQHDENNSTVYVDGTDNETDSLPLTKENIKKLDSEIDADGILVINTSIPSPMDQFVIYDTPGVNDPSSLSEEIVFDLLGKVDVIVFMMRADSALKKTEIDFLQKLVLKKDLGKFFFIINFADTLTQEDAAEVRQLVVNGLGQLLQWPIKALEQQVFLCSAKQVLISNRQKTLESKAETNFFGVHNELLESIQTFSATRYEELITAFAENIMLDVAKNVTDKLSAIIDHAEGKDEGYLQALEQINAEINDFRHQINTSELAFREEIRKKKRALLSKIEEEFGIIREEVKCSIVTSNDLHAGDAAWVQKHIRKLIDDKINLALEDFFIQIKGACENFDLQIIPSLNRSIDKIEGIQKSFDFSSILAGTGVATAGYALFSTVFPWVLGATGIATFGITALSFIPGMGIATGAILASGLKTGVSGMANLISGGSGFIGVTYTGVRDKIHSWVDESDKQRYMIDLDKIIFDMEMALVKQLETTILPEKISAAVIDNKFPLKQEIIAKQKQEIVMDRQLLASNIEEMILIRQEIQRVIHG